MGAIILEVEVAHKMSRRLPMYFSIVLLSADCASRERESASLMTTTGIARIKGVLAERTGTICVTLMLTFESVLCVQVYLLRLSNLLEHILDDQAVITSSIAGDEDGTMVR